MRRLKKIYITVAVLLIVGLFAYKIIYRAVKSSLLGVDSPNAKAVLIDEKVYMGNSPVSHEHYLKYQFHVGTDVYKGNSMDPKLKVGDTILIRFVKAMPSMNEPVSMSKESNRIYKPSPQAGIF
jgi:hypothetical protein